MATRKIVLIGPESSGKTTLGLQLAEHFNAPFVPEFARGYLENGGEVKSGQDLVWLAQKQLQSENEALAKSKSSHSFCDTDLHNIVVWSQKVFGYVEPELEQLEVNQVYDLYLLLKPDIPWIKDKVRENLACRNELFNIYHERLVEKQRQYALISGTKKQRLSLAFKHCF